MPKRKAISKKDRFEVFKRDGFRCIYCGKSPPEVTLELDHIIPVADDGPSHMDNYATSCYECNRGKGKRSLSETPESVAQRTEEIREREEQYRAFKRVLRQQAQRVSRDICSVEGVFRRCYPDKEFTEAFRRSVRTFNEKLTLPVVMDGMQMACDRMSDHADNTLRYFCGICWNKIRGEAPK